MSSSTEVRRVRPWQAVVLTVVFAALTAAVLPPGGAAAQDGGAPATRLEGPTRLETAVAVSQSTFPSAGSAGVVVLARADDPADSYAATPLAVARGGPILLTPRDGVPPVVLTEIRRVLGADGTVVLAGGEAAIASSVGSQLIAEGFEVDRLAGATRFETAAVIAAATTDMPSVVMLADGGDFGAALPAATTAALEGGVVLLTDSSGLPAATQQVLDETAVPPGRVVAVGDAAVLAAGERSDTAVAGSGGPVLSAGLAARHWATTPPTAAVLASAADFPDALTGGVAAVAAGGPLLLTDPAALSEPINAVLRDARPDRLVVLGGVAALPQGTAEAAALAARGSQAPPPTPPAPPADPVMDQARAIPGNRAYAYDPCPPRPDSRLIPVDAMCVSSLVVDLDGDGTDPLELDRIVLWQRIVGEFGESEITVAMFTTSRGALEPYSMIGYAPPQDDGPRSGYALECITVVDPTSPLDVFVTLSVGANTWVGEIVQPGGGAVRPLTLNGAPFTWAAGGGVRFGVGYRVAPGLLTTTTYDDEAGSPYGWSEDDYRVSDGQASYVTSRFGQTSDPGRYGGSGCPSGQGTFREGP